MGREWDFSLWALFLSHIFSTRFSYQGCLGSFFRSAVPVDIGQGSPNPSLWGVPSATLANTSCNIEQYFVNHSIIFGKYNLLSTILFFLPCAYDRYHLLWYGLFSQIHVCFIWWFVGDWAGSSYATSGCPGTCAERLMSGANFVVRSQKESQYAFYSWCYGRMRHGV